jgi:hypothetical protein
VKISDGHLFEEIMVDKRIAYLVAFLNQYDLVKVTLVGEHCHTGRFLGERRGFDFLEVH